MYNGESISKSILNSHCLSPKLEVANALEKIIRSNAGVCSVRHPHDLF